MQRSETYYEFILGGGGLDKFGKSPRSLIPRMRPEKDEILPSWALVF